MGRDWFEIYRKLPDVYEAHLSADFTDERLFYAELYADYATGMTLQRNIYGFAPEELADTVLEAEGDLDYTNGDPLGTPLMGMAAAGKRIRAPRNPFGKSGGPAHQAVIKGIVSDLKRLYADNPNIRIQTELRISTPGGWKPYRYVDAAAVDMTTGKPVSLHQVGVQRGGEPVPREVQAMDDIEMFTGIRPQFHNYNQD